METAAATNDTPQARNLARFRELAGQMKAAVEKKDRRDIIRIYEEMEECDLEAIPDEVLLPYDELVNKSIRILTA